ncbi:l-ornithine N(alpha)-acyltransferase [Pararhizobium mangrovi]|uniref:L-ornithine N(alpha)-acyltransferase n=1 Tax=Pararhizobium mangrovi TaxID=2590452 RepID=A0A506U579_9HYPH|nr:GNAT family N-acetyltransferase [Pararhizobium mangrovi]TPW28341.1 GNAT family N-acetyltransferase [Pararhizobium mangrovi]
MAVGPPNRYAEQDRVRDVLLQTCSEKPETDAEASRPLGRIGTLETRLATTAAEVAAAQGVRFRVFAEEMGATMSPANTRLKRDIDPYDSVCDHLLVFDTAIEGDREDQIVGTYRLLRGSVARTDGGFYSESEFTITDLLERHPGKHFMELGRSCVLPGYRTRRTLELLWQGNWAYSLQHGIDVMFGCASFAGTRPEDHALALSYLTHCHAATREWAVSALPGLYQPMDLVPKEEIEPRRALSALPPLVKGYLRLGAMVGDGAFVDHDFRTTDVMIVLPIARISERYINYYGADAARFS